MVILFHLYLKLFRMFSIELIHVILIILVICDKIFCKTFALFSMAGQENSGHKNCLLICRKVKIQDRNKAVLKGDNMLTAGSLLHLCRPLYQLQIIPWKSSLKLRALDSNIRSVSNNFKRYLLKTLKTEQIHCKHCVLQSDNENILIHLQEIR